MLLAADIGNTNIVLALFDGERLVDSWRVRTERSSTADELALSVRALLATVGVEPASLAGIAVSSTVPALLRTAKAMLARWFPAVDSLVVEPGTDVGVRLAVDNPPEVGTDRVMNTLAAGTLFGGPCVVVDFGTSTNFDVVGPDGAYLGGAIAPGIELSLDALTSRAAQLSRVPLQAPPSAIGRNTAACLQSGVLYGAAGQVDGIVGRILAELGTPVTAVVATGGLAPLVLPASAVLTDHRPDLTLVGLRLAFERTRG